MEIMPSKYENLELSREERIFIKNIESISQFGFLLLNTNPAMLPNEKLHILICADGIIFLKFFDEMKKPKKFADAMPTVKKTTFDYTKKIVSQKLLSNKSLVTGEGDLRFRTNLIYVFPRLKRGEITALNNKQIQSFASEHCWFQEDLQMAKKDFNDLIDKSLVFTIVDYADPELVISNDNVNSILQRIAPEYSIIRTAYVDDEQEKAGVDNELLVITDDDKAVRAFRLDEDQINIVNKINKGEQLILACAGAGKTVILIAKCFKAAEMNPDKKFLITCYNKNLCDLCNWYIDMAGYRNRNVQCITFHALCYFLLEDNNLNTHFTGANIYDQLVTYTITNFNNRKIKNRYYGIFIDEVQQFTPEWYKFCFNLLENRDSEEHLFVICGDLTQKLANLQHHGRAPWNVGEGYPNYRGGNKSIKIRTNYRNCIEINNYINQFVECYKTYLTNIQKDAEIDPEMFLSGESKFHGSNVILRHLKEKKNYAEAAMVVDSINKIHKVKIPYDEIAVIMYEGKYSKPILGWQEIFDLQDNLEKLLTKERIPFRKMYNRSKNWVSLNSNNEGVNILKPMTAEGLDFQAVIVCGLAPLGAYHNTKAPDWGELRSNEEAFQEQLDNIKLDVQNLYVACTRARNILIIILPETSGSSIYIKMLEDAEENYKKAYKL